METIRALGYANVMYPALRKLYKDDDDKLQEALRENIEFFNTNIHFLPTYYQSSSGYSWK